jgi:hypothetical protein
MAIVPMTLSVFVTGIIVGYALGIAIVLVRVKDHFDWAVVSKTAPYIVPILLVYAFVFAVAISLFYPCSITSTGVYGHSFWGLRRYLGWNEISAAKKKRIGNLVFLSLSSKTGGAAIWLPLFQSRRAEFVETVRKSASPNHPVLSQLD